VGFTGGARILVDDGERVGGLAGDSPSVFGRVPDRRRTTDELRIGVVALTDSVQAAKDKCDLTPEDAAILVDFVDDDEIERAEKPLPEPARPR